MESAPGDPCAPWSADAAFAGLARRADPSTVATLALEAAGFSRGASALLVAMISGRHVAAIDRSGLDDGVLHLTLRQAAGATTLASRARRLEQKSASAVRDPDCQSARLASELQASASNGKEDYPLQALAASLECSPMTREHATDEAPDMNDRLMRPHELATMLDLSESALARRRMKGDGPPFVRAGYRSVRYRRGDVLAWLAACTSSSSTPAEAS